MKDTEIQCQVADCYWNMGTEEKDNCACREIKIAYTCICRSYISKEEAKRRLDEIVK